MGARALLATGRSALADRIEDRLPMIEQRTVVVCGEHDPFVSAEWGEQVATLLPDSQLVVVPGEPHAVHFTQPDLVAALVRGLLLEEDGLARPRADRPAPAWEPRPSAALTGTADAGPAAS
jgi:pimeloyl-ACP methyl ester carboxylesterase